MAVVGRKRKSGTAYYAVREWHGRQVAELVGTSKREAEIRDRAMKKEIDDGTYEPPEHRKALTVREFSDVWGKRRTNASAEDERRILRLYVLGRPWFADRRLDEIRPRDVDRLVRELQAEKLGDGARRLTDKTIANTVGVLRQLFSAAMREDRCIRQPVVLEPGLLRRSPTVEREAYTVAEAVVLMRHHAIPESIRVLNALCLLGGLREGEACGRRWRDLDGAPAPLPSLTVADQYGGKKLKTERPRVVPVHPELATVLEGWAREGFELLTGRKPEPDDFIVPNVGPRSKKKHHTRSSYYKAFVRTAAAAGVTTRSLHATRHTFISLCRRGGARKDVLERVTHNARGDIIDRYTHLDWLPLCEAVLCLSLDVHPDLHRDSGTLGDSEGARRLPGGTRPNESAALPTSLPGSIPGASTDSTAELGSAEESAQESAQDSERNAESFSVSDPPHWRELHDLAEAARAALWGARVEFGSVPAKVSSRRRRGVA